MTSTLMLYLKPCLPCLLWQHLKDGHSKLTSQFQNSYFLSRKIEKNHFLYRKTQFLFLMQSDKKHSLCRKTKETKKLISYAERQKSYFLCIKTNILFLLQVDKKSDFLCIERQKSYFVFTKNVEIMLSYLQNMT